ncbi:MAG: glutamate-1-semialdehyde 2,1-aminomutase [Cytophagaceae bacterium]|nr:glutamate-1-semialdehyde 2,1-aminomutase [Gemmatimonadaceae bacterium]
MISPIMTRTQRSEEVFAHARTRMPGGVSSPVRAFRAVGGVPRVIARGEGPVLVDVDDNTYIDYVLSWGALILGHADPDVSEAVIQQVRRGTTFGAPTAVEGELAEVMCAAVPSLEMVRFVSSGTEATMSAIRLARAVTGRNRIIKFAGCYHGHADALLAQAGSGIATLGLPDSAGVTHAATADTLVAPYNDADAVAGIARAHKDQVAAILVEPVAGNMGFVLPAPGFLAQLRAIATSIGALLIFDEVMTGFRVAWGGAQVLFDIEPDLSCFGKVMGGGLPAAAYGGRRDFMMRVAPEGPMYQAGTLSGNPVAMSAGLATLHRLAHPGTYEMLGRLSAELAAAVREEAEAAGVPLVSASLGGMWGFFFLDGHPANYAEAQRASAARYRQFFHALLDRGVYLAPSQFEAAFVSTAHGPGEIHATRAAFRQAFSDLRSD